MSEREEEAERAAVDLSIVVPLYNEVENVEALVEEVWAALEAYGRPFEVLLVDDGSTDGTVAKLREVAATRAEARVVLFRRNFGQTAALSAGFAKSRGRFVVSMDGDLQNDARDIPALIAKVEEGHDIAAGWRKDRQDPFLNRRLPSMIANKIISTTTGVKLHDYGCTLKAFRGEVARSIKLYGEMHRFIPAVANWMGVSVVEVPVNHRARRAGTSKYGITRTVRVILDLLTVKFLDVYATKPIQIFGLLGILALGIGAVGSGYLGLGRLLGLLSIAERPVFFVYLVLIVIGIQFISMGLIAEMLARTYHESQDKPTYHIKEILEGR